MRIVGCLLVSSILGLSVTSQLRQPLRSGGLGARVARSPRERRAGVDVLGGTAREGQDARRPLECRPASAGDAALWFAILPVYGTLSRQQHHRVSGVQCFLTCCACFPSLMVVLRVFFCFVSGLLVVSCRAVVFFGNTAVYAWCNWKCSLFSE